MSCNFRQPDVVFIFWSKQDGHRRIDKATIVGSAHPCVDLLDHNDRLSRAKDCLLANGFNRVFHEKFGEFGVSVFIRHS